MVKETDPKPKKRGNPNPTPFGGPGPGRPAGIPNKTTTQFKEALNNLLETAAPEMVTWLGEIKDPEKRFDVLAKFAEYIYPKLARQELVGDDKNPIAVRDVTDIKLKLLKAIPEDQLNAIIATAGDNNGGPSGGTGTP
jgi:hypothetical protein